MVCPLSFLFRLTQPSLGNGAFRGYDEKFSQPLPAGRTKAGAIEAHDLRDGGVRGVNAVRKAEQPRQEDVFGRGQVFSESHHLKRIV
jgi:hypothetical protein